MSLTTTTQAKSATSTSKTLQVPEGCSFAGYLRGVMTGEYEVQKAVAEAIAEGKFSDESEWAMSLMQQWHEDNPVSPEDVLWVDAITSYRWSRHCSRCEDEHTWSSSVLARVFGQGAPACIYMNSL